MIWGLVEESCYSVPVLWAWWTEKVVFSILHTFTDASDLVMELLKWETTSEVHMLIRSYVFRFELKLIHHFADGNGCVGRR